MRRRSGGSAMRSAPSCSYSSAIEQLVRHRARQIDAGRRDHAYVAELARARALAHCSLPGPRLIARSSLRCGPRPTCAISLTSSVPPLARAQLDRRRAAARRLRRDRRARSRGACAGRSRASRRATRSRPVPCSPSISTGASIGGRLFDALAQLDHRRADVPSSCSRSTRAMTAAYYATCRRELVNDRSDSRATRFCLIQRREVRDRDLAHLRRTRRHMERALAHVRGVAQTLGVPGDRLAHLVHQPLGRRVRGDQIDVAAKTRMRSGDRRRRDRLAAQARLDGAEQPRIAERAAADHHRVAAGLLAHAEVVVDGRRRRRCRRPGCAPAPPSRTSRMIPRSRLPEKPCVRVRPCTVIIARRPRPSRTRTRAR